MAFRRGFVWWIFISYFIHLALEGCRERSFYNKKYTKGRYCEEVLCKESRQNDNEDGFRLALAMVGYDGLKISLGLKRRNYGKRKFMKSRLQYYCTNSSSSTFQLESDGTIRSQIIMSGDILQNPGPIRNPCSACGRPVAKNHHALDCNRCEKRCHIGPKCGNISLHDYKKMLEETSLQWECPSCATNLEIRLIENQSTATMESIIEERETSFSGNAFEELKIEMGQHGIKIGHLNVNRLLSKLSQIELLLVECKFDIFAITETHLNSKIRDEEISITGYSMERQDRKGKGGGGCLIYYKDNLTVVPFSDDIEEFKAVESAWIEVNIMSQKFLLGALYRPPTDFKFCGNLQTILSKIMTKRKNMILMGDLNSDLLQRSNENHPGKKLKRILYSYDLTNIIKEPTRISDTTETLIDLIIVKDDYKISKHGVFEPGISDHKLIFCTLNIKRKYPKAQFKEVRVKKAFDEEGFKQLLDQTPFWIANIFDDVDDVCYTWDKLYKDILDEFTKTRRAKVMTHKHPWINREIKKLMNKRYKVLVQWQQNRTESRLRKIYQELRNKVNKSLRKAEANYWKEQFANASSSKEFWQTVGKLRKKTKNANIVALKDDDGMLKTLDTEKVEILNNFFADVGENLAKKFGESNRCGNSFINRITPICDEIKVNEEKLLHQIFSLKPNKAIGDDMISGKELRSGGKSVIPGLKGVFNKCYETGKFPNIKIEKRFFLSLHECISL
eukprot:Seg604.7 transcript_id=Seg604.7/GoldUCD/mRNA.D3Y31 product="putative RNA-directed DNA polymerase from transposon X-element" pseudo=true protein_id=Seg604.7/GoldUCD/D3Y31